MYELNVTGMTCQGCVKSVTNALKNIDANANVQIDLVNSLVKIDSKASKDQLIVAIEDAGFNVKKD